jgi:hypothetical protein
MTNGERAPLHELYNRVCAKRPDAKARVFLDGGHWFDPSSDVYVSEETASALILRHWLSLVQNYDDLCHPNGKWRMFDGVGARIYPCADTPLEAIAAYLEAQQ